MNAVTNTIYSEKSWSTKLAEWGVTKNRRKDVTDAAVPTEKRKLEECKDTKDFHKGTKVTEERNGTYKKRKTGQASYKMGEILHTQSLISGRTARTTPLEVTLNTESNLKSDDYILEVISLPYLSFKSILTLFRKHVMNLSRIYYLCPWSQTSLSLLMVRFNHLTQGAKVILLSSPAKETWN